MTESNASSRRWRLIAVAVLALLIGLWQAQIPPPVPALKVKLPPRLKLTVESSPPGASVFVNGRLAGASPVLLEGLASGSYGLRLERDGCRPLLRTVSLDTRDEVVVEQMEPVPTGELRVEVEPAGAEVLLDGELAGHTPLQCSGLPAGTHLLQIRKTNFDPFVSSVTISPDAPAVFAGFELTDRLLALLNRMVKTEPQRLAHYIDLGHYLFINNRMKEAVEVFTQGLEVLQTPLDFNQPGYPGLGQMTEAEIALEKRLRRDDEARYPKEINKHRNWPRKDTREFRRRLDEAQEVLSSRNIDSWPWVDRAAKLFSDSRNYDQAVKLYTSHIASAPHSPGLAQAYTAVMSIRLKQRQLARAGELFTEFMAKCGGDEAGLHLCGSAILLAQNSFAVQAERTQVLNMAEKALRRAVELPSETQEAARCKFDLASALMCLQRPADAVPFFEQSVNQAQEDALKEQRSLQWAEALRLAGRLDEARVLFSRLKLSKTAEISTKAHTGLVSVSTEELKKRTGKK